MMRALRFDQFGPPSVLRMDNVPPPVAEAGRTAVVAIKATSVNPSDVKNVAGAMRGTLLPRTPGRDFSGVVLEGPEDWRGVPVWGTGGDVGFTRDGAHAELMAVPVAGLARKPARLSHDDAACVGVNFVTAWLGAVEYGAVGPDDRVAVIGVGGGVGGAVVQIALQVGARVIGLARAKLDPDTPAAAGLHGFIRLDEPDLEVRLRAMCGGEGPSLIYDTVGGAVTTALALACVARRGRVITISATTGRSVTFDLIDFYRNETRLIGADSRKLDLVASARLLSAMAPHFESGAYRPLPVTRRYSLADGPAAYRAVAEGVRGRVVLWP
jgi:NADPH:quinone reductase-like Zn-dependent oxidoreductase